MKIKGGREKKCAAPGAYAVVDDQGQSQNCTSFAVAKAVTEGAEDLGMDVDQGEVCSALVNQTKETCGKFADDFNSVEVQVMDKKTKLWYFFTLIITQCTSVEEFKTDYKAKKGRFVCDTEMEQNGLKSPHCMYAKKYEKGRVVCMNSWGEKKKNPRIKDADVVHMYRVCIVAHDRETGQFRKETDVPKVNKERQRTNRPGSTATNKSTQEKPGNEKFTKESYVNKVWNWTGEKVKSGVTKGGNSVLNFFGLEIKAKDE